MKLNCPPLTECNEIPNSKREIKSHNIARDYSHLKDIEPFIPEIDTEPGVLLLIGLNMLLAHYELEQRLGKAHELRAERLRLRWSSIGQSCLGKVHASEKVLGCKISILPNGR